MSNHRKQAFLRGFASGMASPFTVFLPSDNRYDTGPKDLVARSWKQVGMVLESAMNAEGQRQSHENTTSEQQETP